MQKYLRDTSPYFCTIFRDSEALMRFFRLFRTRLLDSQSLGEPSQPIKTYLFALSLPLLSIILAIIFSCCIYYAKICIEQATSRNAQLQVQALCHEIERTLYETRNQLLFLAADPDITKENMTRRLSYRTKDKKNQFRELAFIGRDPDNRFVLINNDGDIESLPRSVVKDARNNPFERLSDVRQPGNVSIAEPTQVTYSMVPVGSTVQNLSFAVMRFSTPVYDYQGDFIGILLLSLDLSVLRDSLTLFSSPSSPLHDTQSDFKHMRSLFFDTQGWMLFQSESPDALSPVLSTDAMRSGLAGDFGRPGFSIAFRPSPVHEDFWGMVAAVQAGKSGQMGLGGRSSWGSGPNAPEYLNYSPVTFRNEPGAPLKVVGGVATLDASYSAARTTSLLWAALVLSLILALCATGGGLFWVGRRLENYVDTITENLRGQNIHDTENYLPSLPIPREMQELCKEINIIFSRLRQLKNDHDTQENARTARWQREPVPDMPQAPAAPVLNIVGQSAVIEDLRQQIKKAASVFADVLVIGETGTGKEVVSAAIHQASERRDKPYISINCGALDENLLMDTLFGHVKGAFTEARTDRKGAFLAAEGGTLMLDEIGNAAPRVQQAMLRALSTRRIRPLGSDQEIAFNARIVAATNVDLREEAKQGKFREDLYYRLAVITIHTPPLRQRKEDIPLLTSYFLQQAALELGSPAAAMTKGALDKLMRYEWPGNVRQLKNSLTRALAFSDSGQIYAESIIFSEQAQTGDLPWGSAPFCPYPPEKQQPAPPVLTPPAGQGENNTPQPPEDDALARTLLQHPLNKRQCAILPLLRTRGGLSRQEYQELAGEGISTRTAQYDLQELVRFGVLRREGRGPSLRYIPAAPEDKGERNA